MQYNAMKKDATKKDATKKDATQIRCNVLIADHRTYIHTPQDAIFSTKDPNQPPIPAIVDLARKLFLPIFLQYHVIAYLLRKAFVNDS